MVQWQQIARAEGFKATSPLLSVPSKLVPFSGDIVAALFSGQKLWVETGNAYYAVKLDRESLRVTIAKYAANSAHIEVKNLAWRYADDEVIYLLVRNPVFVEAD
jgi:hypothetical protein